MYGVSRRFSLRGVLRKQVLDALRGSQLICDAVLIVYKEYNDKVATLTQQTLHRKTLMAVGLFGVMLGAVGLPIYLHAPKYFSDTYGVSLVSLGVIMFVLRLLDFAQDPLLGRLSAIGLISHRALSLICLLYTSDAADDSLRVDLGGRRII